MPRRAPDKTVKPGSTRNDRSKRLALLRETSASRKNSLKKALARSAGTGKFISANTGRIVKSSPAKPNLGRERIRTAVTNYVNRES